MTDQPMTGSWGPATIARLSTHVLDTTLGRPAGRIPAVLEHVAPDGSSVEVGRGLTDLDGRIQQLNDVALTPGEYRLILVTGGYFNEHHDSVFYPTIAVQFRLSGDREHYHIAVLASTYSYATYLGS
jgi:5-hydroxyisourate hydrolase